VPAGHVDVERPTGRCGDSLSPVNRALPFSNVPGSDILRWILLSYTHGRMTDALMVLPYFVNRLRFAIFVPGRFLQIGFASYTTKLHPGHGPCCKLRCIYWHQQPLCEIGFVPHLQPYRKRRVAHPKT
jgi:hypothetical protein